VKIHNTGSGTTGQQRYRMDDSEKQKTNKVAKSILILTFVFEYAQ